jgi:hypothetical protein
MVNYRDALGEEKYSVAGVDAIRKKPRTNTTVLKEIPRIVRRKKRIVERAVVDLYDSLSGEETDEQARWGEFALGEFPNEIT